jgi:UDP-N-acetylmuramoylalanine-D-glutamate ligase
MKKSLILGYGITGKSFEAYLSKRKINFDILDEQKSFIPDNFTGTQSFFDIYDSVYISPGINFKKLFPAVAIEQINFMSDLDIFFKKNNSFKIGITGTNGKSSLAYYLEQLLNQVSSAIALGNYGNALLDNLEHTRKYSIIEVSSFQLDKMKENNFDLTVITNIKRDHIDYHGCFESYKGCKLKICGDGIKNLISDDETELSHLAFQVFEYLEPKTNLDNFQLKELPHRLEEFRRGFINDSKSTNLASLEYALKKMNFEGNLIICGDPAKESYSNYHIEGPQKVLIFGRHAKEIEKLIFHDHKLVFETLDSLLRYLLDEKVEGDVLFSPGHPSGQDFQNFEIRGNSFKEKVNEYFS